MPYGAADTLTPAAFGSTSLIRGAGQRRCRIFWGRGSGGALLATTMRRYLPTRSLAHCQPGLALAAGAGLADLPRCGRIGGLGGGSARRRR